MGSDNYQIGLASRTYLQNGAVIIKPIPGDTDIRSAERRVSRVKTLDGGCAITDGGVSAGDKTFSISLQSDKTVWDLMNGIFKNASWITVSTDESCYLAKIENIKEAAGKIVLSILIKEDLGV